MKKIFFRNGTRLPIILLLPFMLVLFFSFSTQPKTGKEIFQENCSACHGTDNVLVGPPFQKIRQDYGLNWTLQFVKNYEILLNKKDTKALHVYYLYYKIPHPTFETLNNNDIVKILDYVDSFPADTSLYGRRKIAESERKKFISKAEAEANKQ